MGYRFIIFSKNGAEVEATYTLKHIPDADFNFNVVLLNMPSHDIEFAAFYCDIF